MRPTIEAYVSQCAQDLAFAYDTDSGPVKAWRWAYHHQNAVVGLASPDMRWLRQNGYIFFDSGRLQAWGILNTPYSTQYQLYAASQSSESHEAMKLQRSFRERSEIFARGGRGWWSEGDQSRIRWLNECPEEISTVPSLFDRKGQTAFH